MMSAIEDFIDRWSGLEGGQERANYALFLSELCDVIEVERPQPASASHETNDYVFERAVEGVKVDGTIERGRIDLYKRGCFILEAKQSRLSGPKREVTSQGDLFLDMSKEDQAKPSGWDVLMMKARKQAEGYARKLPDDHPYPPFIMTCDVGRYIELFADFSGTGRHYTPFPDTNSFKVELEALRDENIRKRISTVWTNPHELDPSKQSAKVTREIAARLADISKALEDRGYDAEKVAMFLMRCLFTMFVEDAALIPPGKFTETLKECVKNPRRFAPDMEHLWRTMDQGGYSPLIGEWILRFNGKLFKDARAFPLEKDEIILLKNASEADWRDLEPAIFGSLFEQALDPKERKRLGAHYTPRAYVERIVNATIIEPLLSDWSDAKATAKDNLNAGSKQAALNDIISFLGKLSNVTVLDPSCGTGNFLYVALKQMKQLEGDVVNLVRELGGEDAVKSVDAISVMPAQFLGMEINSRAVQIAELVLWIGYIQWHLKTRNGPPPEPVIHDSDHVIEKDAVLAWGRSCEWVYKIDPFTTKPKTRPGPNGEKLPIRLYENPRAPEWLDADFIVGNPPFIGGKDIRSRLSDEYAEALWKAHPEINKSADFVMYWWDACARMLRSQKSELRRFGLITTNSITQSFQRRVVAEHLNAKDPISILLAIPDHPWTKTTQDAAAVRIAITVAAQGEHDGQLGVIRSETDIDTDKPNIELEMTKGRINADLTVGVDVGTAKPLISNSELCYRGVQLMGSGFIVSPGQAGNLGLCYREGLENYIREYRNGRDLTSRPRGVKVIDLFGLTVHEVRQRFPEVYQHVIKEVKEKRDENGKLIGRDANNRATYKKNWWIFGEPRSELRPALKNITRYVATAETMKHRAFQFLDTSILPDNMLVAVATDDAFVLGVLSSRIHVVFALASGGILGPTPRWQKSRCFDPFPFPETSETLKDRIRQVAEELDLTRKLVLEEQQDLTLTQLYNVLEKVVDGTQLSNAESDICTRGRVLILKELHDQIDKLTFEAYGWSQDLSDQEILSNLVELNKQRVDEERRGFIRWLRPDYQISKVGPLAHKADKVQSISTASRKKKKAFPTERVAQAAEIRELVQRSDVPLSAEQIAATFSNSDKIKDRVKSLLRARYEIGDFVTYDEGRSYIAANR